MAGLSDRDAKFLRVHGATFKFKIDSSYPPVHVGFGCVSGNYRVQANVVAADEPQVLLCALRKLNPQT